jgi:hypothetical protein
MRVRDPRAVRGHGQHRGIETGNTAADVVFQTVMRFQQASLGGAGNAKSRSPHISGTKTLDLPRGPDRVGVVCLAIVVLVVRKRARCEAGRPETCM